MQGSSSVKVKHERNDGDVNEGWESFTVKLAPLKLVGRLARLFKKMFSESGATGFMARMEPQGTDLLPNGPFISFVDGARRMRADRQRITAAEETTMCSKDAFSFIFDAKIADYV